MQQFYVSTPIYYVNDKPHIGHAYTSVAADVIARFKRLDGFDVFFLTGTDEHGQKVQKSANKNNVDTQSFVDKFASTFIDVHKLLNCSNDDFIRTTQNRHKEFVSTIWSKLEQADYIYLDKYAGWYSVRDEAFYQESELIDGKAPTGAEVEWVEEESYFFRLSSFQDALLNFYDDNPQFIMPTGRKNEVISFVKSGLRDLSISRTSFDWGIPVPKSKPASQTIGSNLAQHSSTKKHVMYVWIDALFNYISASPNKWPCSLHIVGKDILRFHAVYWPALLMALDMPLPGRVFAHGWWTNDGQKISKSLGNTLDPVELVNEFSVDYLRFYMMREFPFGNDGNYSRNNFIQRINSELANNIGNLTQRTLSIAIKRLGNSVPKINGQLDESDKNVLLNVQKALPKMRDFIDNQQIHNAIGVVVDLCHLGNEYIDIKAPWAVKDNAELNNTIFTLLNLIFAVGVLLQPFIPDSASKILEIFGCGKLIDDAPVEFKVLLDVSRETKNAVIDEGMNITKPDIIFKRLEV